MVTFCLLINTTGMQYDFHSILVHKRRDTFQTSQNQNIDSAQFELKKQVSMKNLNLFLDLQIAFLGNDIQQKSKPQNCTRNHIKTYRSS